MSLFDRIRQAAARVTEAAGSVRIDPPALSKLADELAAERPPPPELDPTHVAFPGDPAATLTYVLTMNAINFGSGWFPVLRKLPGRSGYLTLASHWRTHFEREGTPTPGALRMLDVTRCREIFDQPEAPESDELMGLYARALGELGTLVADAHGGSFEALVAAAEGSAERLVRALAEMPLYRDVSRYAGFEVPFYKRAQITASDLHAAFAGAGPGKFADLERLTLFADNLVPHVLRMSGVLELDPALCARIDRGELLAHGSEPEVELRAVALHAVELLVQACAERGYPTRAAALDHVLWARGQAPEIKAVPRHRTRCTFY